MLNAIISAIVAGVVAFTPFFAQTPRITSLENRVESVQSTLQSKIDDISLSGFNPAGGTTYRLQSSIGTTNTSVRLSSFKNRSGIELTMTLLDTDIGYGTLSPQTSRSEFISFTGITQNSDGTATLTGVSRGLSDIQPFTASSTLRQAHPGQSVFILSNSPQFQEEYAARRSNETIEGTWNFYHFPTSTSTPTDSNQFATKAYADGLAIAGAPDGTYTVKGLYEQATNQEAASSTASGATGAELALTSDISSALCDVATSTVVVTKSNGKINGDCLDGAEPMLRTASTTFHDRFETDANDTNNIVLNTKAYSFPSTYGAGNATTSLQNDGAGNLAWLLPQSRVLYANGTASTSNGHVGTTTAFTIPIPANILGTGSVIRVTTKTSGTGSGGRGPQMDIQFGDGSASTTIAYHNLADVTWSVQSSIFSTTASAQETFSSSDIAGTAFAPSPPVTTANPSYRAATSLDSTAENYLSFRVNSTNTSNTSTIKGILVEVLTQ